MDSLLLKSFIPEMFLATVILIQLLVNTRFFNKPKNNYPLIVQEAFIQTIFILICYVFLLKHINIEGILSNGLLLNSEPVNITKSVFCIYFIIVICVIYDAMQAEKIQFTEFFTILLIVILALMLMLATSDLLMLYLLLEIQTISIYILTVATKDCLFASGAGIKYFTHGAFFAAIFLFGVTIIYAVLGTANLGDICLLLAHDLNSYSFGAYNLMLFGIVLVTTLFLFKISCAPFHSWSPDVYGAAPLASTVAFALIPKIGIFFMFIKWLNSIHHISPTIILNLIMGAGILSIIVGTFFALMQKELKRLLLYSSIVTTGFLVMTAATSTIEGNTSSIFFLILYLITSTILWIFYTLFFRFVIEIEGHPRTIYTSDLKAVFASNKSFTTYMTIVIFSIAGVPPFGGFFTKANAFNILIKYGFITTAIFVAIISGIGVFYYIQLLKNSFFDASNDANADNLKLGFYAKDSSTRLIIYLIPVLTIPLLLIAIVPHHLFYFSEYIVMGIFRG